MAKFLHIAENYYIDLEALRAIQFYEHNGVIDYGNKWRDSENYISADFTNHYLSIHTMDRSTYTVDVGYNGEHPFKFDIPINEYHRINREFSEYVGRQQLKAKAS